MAETTSSGTRVDHDGASVGDLVALTVRDLTKLVRYEVDLAKLELRADARRLGLSAAMLGIASFAGFLVLDLLCFALAFGLVAAGIWEWAAFLIVAGVCVVVAAAAIGVVAIKMRRMSGLRRTRETVHDDIAMLRREEPAPAPLPTKAG